MSISAHCPRGYRSIRLPLSQDEYLKFMRDTCFAREKIDEYYQQYPELFPKKFSEGYVFNIGVPPI